MVTDQTRRCLITSGLQLHYSKLSCWWHMCIHVFDEDREQKSQRDSTMVYDELFVFVCACISECVCLREKVLQWYIYDTPFTRGGASCLSFFIPRSLMGLWWWWRDGPSPLALMPPWAEEGPPPRPPEECCTLRSLLLSTRICGKRRSK